MTLDSGNKNVFLCLSKELERTGREVLEESISEDERGFVSHIISSIMLYHYWLERMRDKNEGKE